MSNSILLNITLGDLTKNQVKALGSLVESFQETAVDPKFEQTEKDPKLAFLESITVQNETKEEPVKKTRASKKNTTVQEGAFKGQERTESHVDDYEAAKETVVNEPTDADDDFLGGGEKVYTRDEIRTAAAPLMSDHRQALKDKIKELGADSLINLEESKFPAFMLFIDSLK